jgi:hypothetical protein
MIHLGACQSLLQPLLLFIREACILDGAGGINPRRDGLRELMRAIRTLGGEVPAMEGSDGREARQAICLLRCARLIVALCLVFGLCINAGSNGLGAILQRLNWTNGIVCASKMIALSIPPLIGLGVLMRRDAPTDTRGTALLVGLAAAAWGAFVFACPFNDPLYIAVWYSVGCGIVTFLSRFVLPYLARW